jgi:hypothetical protein
MAQRYYKLVDYRKFYSFVPGPMQRNSLFLCLTERDVQKITLWVGIPRGLFIESNEMKKAMYNLFLAEAADGANPRIVIADSCCSTVFV